MWSFVEGIKIAATYHSRLCAVVAQLDRATGYELVGWGFESLRPRICAEASRKFREASAPKWGMAR
jgi:hypothetical protein